MKYYSEDTVKGLLEQMDSHFVKYLENLPSIEVKEPHERCIDSYSLAVKVAEAQGKLKGKEYDPFMLLGDVLRWIELEPTVLEASEGRE